MDDNDKIIEDLQYLISRITPKSDANSTDTAYNLLDMSRLVERLRPKCKGTLNILIEIIDHLLSTGWYGWLKPVLYRIELEEIFEPRHTNTLIRVFDVLKSHPYSCDAKSFFSIKSNFYLLFSLQIVIKILGKTDDSRSVERLNTLIQNKGFLQSIDKFVKWAYNKRIEEGIHDELMSPNYI